MKCKQRLVLTINGLRSEKYNLIYVFYCKVIVLVSSLNCVIIFVK